MRLALADGGIRGTTFDGSHRYLDDLTAGLVSLGAEPRLLRLADRSRFHGFTRRCLVAGWTIGGFPSFSMLLGGRDAIVHSVESVMVPRRGRFPLVVTVHDTAPISAPGLVGRRVSTLTRLSWRRSSTWDAVIVPSESSKTMVAREGYPIHRVHVVRHGLADVFRSEPSPEARAWADEMVGGDPYVITVSGVSTKKGSDTMLEAWARTRRRIDGRLIWVTGQTSARSQGPMDDIRWLSGVGDRSLAALYRGARAVVSPSRWEGYSYPMAEGLSLGAPVIATDIPAHREFGIDPSHLFPAGDSVALSELLVEAFEGEMPREPRSFPTLAESAEAHVAVYRMVGG